MSEYNHNISNIDFEDDAIELKTLAYILYLLDSQNDEKAKIRHLVIELIKEKGDIQGSVR